MLDFTVKLLQVVSSLTHPSNVNSKRGLQRVQNVHVHVCTVRKGKYIRKKKLRSVAFKTEKCKQAINTVFYTKWENVPTAEFGMISAETACWDRERKKQNFKI